MPPQERLKVALWLLEDLQESAVCQTGGKIPDANGKQVPPLPDYSGRRRRILGNKVLPNMVLAARAEESW
jgi:hypothetical protein